MHTHLNLPVYHQREKILKAIAEHQVIVVESPTGSGKTTQIPLIMHEAGLSSSGMIGVTQPRRIAAVSVSSFIADQLDTRIPHIVGYKMRFYDETALDTKIKILTDGMLLQEMKLDPMLSAYSVIMVDEAHERSLNIDFILGLLKQILVKRPEFKVIISSATINPKLFSRYFNDCPIIHIDAEMYPVEVSYQPPKYPDEQALYDQIRLLCEQHIQQKRSGDILVFLSGEKQISDSMALLDSSSTSGQMFIIPLFGRLSKELQDRVFIPTPKGKTKVVLSTNIAETSITIDNITLVIDSGLAKLNYYNQRTFTSSLIELPVSRASSNQRKGRAGRTAPGQCIRLYTKPDFLGRPQYTPEEISRTDLSEVLLRMSELGIYDFEGFDYLTSPAPGGIPSALETLFLLGALDETRRLTDIGKMMALFPLSPRHARIIIEAVLNYPQVLEEAIITTAFLSTRSPFVLTPGEEIASRQAHHRFSDPQGDVISQLKLYHTYRRIPSRQQREEFCTNNHLDVEIMDEIIHITAQLSEIISEQDIPMLSGGTQRDLLCCVASGLVQYVCIRSGKYSYRSLTADRINIHPGSVLFRSSPEYIVAGEIVKTSRMYARMVSPLKPQWLEQINPALKQLTAAPSKKQKEPQRQNQSMDQGKIITLWGHSFSLIPYRGKKKLVVLPLEELRTLQPDYSQQVKRLRGKITYKEFDIHPGEKINALLRIYPHIHPEQGIYEEVPKQNFILPGDTSALLEHTYMIMGLCKSGKKHRQLGFITLETNGSHRYWYKVQRSIHSSLETALFSLDRIADEHLEQAGSSSLEQFNEVYRRCSELFDAL